MDSEDNEDVVLGASTNMQSILDAHRYQTMVLTKQMADVLSETNRRFYEQEMRMNVMLENQREMYELMLKLSSNKESEDDSDNDDDQMKAVSPMRTVT